MSKSVALNEREKAMVKLPAGADLPHYPHAGTAPALPAALLSQLPPEQSAGNAQLVPQISCGVCPSQDAVCAHRGMGYFQHSNKAQPGTFACAGASECLSLVTQTAQSAGAWPGPCIAHV